MNTFSSEAHITDDEKYLWLELDKGSFSGLWYAELKPLIESKMTILPKWSKLFNNFDANYKVSKLEFICFRF